MQPLVAELKGRLYGLQLRISVSSGCKLKVNRKAGAIISAADHAFAGGNRNDISR